MLIGGGFQSYFAIWARESQSVQRMSRPVAWRSQSKWSAGAVARCDLIAELGTTADAFYLEQSGANAGAQAPNDASLAANPREAQLDCPKLRTQCMRARHAAHKNKQRLPSPLIFQDLVEN